MTTFIYQPKSGDRVFAQQLRGSIIVVKWSNGCRHVVGGIRLVYETATSGRHWRGAATTMAKQIVSGVGGVAWDDQGTVYLVIPNERALRADELMRAADPYQTESAPGAQNVAALVGGGWFLDHELKLSGSASFPIPFFGPAAVDHKTEEAGTKVMVYLLGKNGLFPAVIAPQEWGVPVEVSCGVDSVDELRKRATTYYTGSDLDMAAIARRAVEYGAKMGTVHSGADTSSRLVFEVDDSRVAFDSLEYDAETDTFSAWKLGSQEPAWIQH